MVLSILCFGVMGVECSCYLHLKSQFHCAYDRLRSQYDCLNINLGVISLTSICKVKKAETLWKTFYKFCIIRAVLSVNDSVGPALYIHFWLSGHLLGNT